MASIHYVILFSIVYLYVYALIKIGKEKEDARKNVES